MIKKIKQAPLHSFLFILFFILNGYAENFGYVTIKSCATLLGVYFISTLLIFLLLNLLLRDWSKAGILTSTTLFFYLFFGIGYDFLTDTFPNSFINKYSFLIPFILGLQLVMFFVLRKKSVSTKVTQFLNYLFALFIITSLFSLFFLKQIRSKPDANFVINERKTTDIKSKPDIYIILLDGYAGESALIEQFNFTNSEFIRSLEEMDFKYFPRSNSNYNYTPYSTASTLNIQYLDSKKASNVRRTGNKYATELINNSSVINFFEQEGYKFYNHSIFKTSQQASPTGGSFVPTNTKLITGTTFLTRFERDVLLNIATRYNIEWYLSERMFSTLRDNEKLIKLTYEVAKKTNNASPKIIYTHLLMPHHPYYYDQNNNLRTFSELNKLPLNDTKAYLDYLKYCNKQILDLIDHIIKHSSKKPIIALFSDHGFRYDSPGYKKEFSFSNFIAIHNSSEIYSGYSDTLNNVNLFREILNNEFDQSLPILPNETFYISF